MARPGLALALVVGLPLGQAAAKPVVVVPLGQGQGYARTARTAIAIRQALASRGRAVVSPSQALSPPPVASAALLVKARQKYQEAVALYDGLEFKKARTAFKETADLFREALRHGGTFAEYTEYAKTLHYHAAAALYDNDRPAAIAHFSEAHSFTPEYKPDDAVFSPDVFKAHQEAVAASAAAQGTLGINSNPSAEVLLNGRPAGATPLQLSGLVAGTYLVRCMRGGYEADAQWITVESGAKAEVRTELKPQPQRQVYEQTLAEVTRELSLPRPGPATARLTQALAARSLVLVAIQADGTTMAVTARRGRWTRRHAAMVAEGGEAAFAGQFLAARVAAAPGGCARPADCPSGQDCVGGRCVAPTAGRPFYKTWWFWTVVGVAVAGGVAAGVVVGTMDRTETWTAVVKPGAME